MKIFLGYEKTMRKVLFSVHLVQLLVTYQGMSL